MIPIKHFGDITKIDGAKVPIVDVITGGSPCQDLSVAGLRKGIQHSDLGDEETTRSGLFMDQIRIVKQQREESIRQLTAEFGENFDRTKIKPKYMVWENVCFCADTQIMTIDGLKPIQDVVIGDKVKTHMGRYMPVVETYVHTDKEVVQVNIIGEQPLICTPNHPIYGLKKNSDGSYGELEFIPAGLLTSNHRVASFWNDKDDKIVYKAIESVTPLNKKETVYNLSVLEDNTYVANGIICHNCGAFSSGTPTGADFQAVLEEIAGVVLTEVPTIPIPTDGWPYAGNIEGVATNNTPFSICWRTHDAQYWGKSIIDASGRVVKAGTPQRRRRIALVADFGGYTAPEILFECEGLSGNTEQSTKERETTPITTGSGSSVSSQSGEVTAVCIGNGQVDNAVSPEVELSKTLNCMQDPMKVLVSPSNMDTDKSKDSTVVFDMLNLNPKDDEKCPTLNAFNGTGGNNMPLVYENHSQDTRYTELGDVCTTVSATYGMGGNNTPFVVEPSSTIAIEGNGSRDSHKGDGYSESDVMYTLNTVEQHAVCVDEPEPCLNPWEFQAKHIQPENGIAETLYAGECRYGGGESYVLQTPSNSVNILNPDDSQGQQIADSDGVYPTLRGCGGGGYQAGYMLDKSKTKEPVLLESNQNHATIQTDGVSTTLPASMGEGGGYVPMVVEDKPTAYGFEPGVAQRLDPENRFTEEVSPTLRAEMGDNQASVVYGIDQQGGKGQANITEDVAPTMASDSHGTPHAVCYGMSSFDSNAMKSDNPESGIYRADTARTLDMNGGNPACNQGGMMVVQDSSELTDTEKQQVEDWVDAVNSSAKHQQDLIQSDLGVARTIACGTHASGPHLTKTLVTSSVTDKPIKESTKSYGVTTKGNGDAFIAEERHTSLSTGGGEAGQGYPCVLTESSESTTYQDTVDSLCAAGYSKLGTQEAQNDMYVVQASNWDGSQISPTLTANNANGAQRMPDKENFNAVIQSIELFHCTTEEELAAPLKARDYKDPQCVVQSAGFCPEESAKTRGIGYQDECSPTLRTDAVPATVYAVDEGGGKSQCAVHEDISPTLATTHHGEPAVCYEANNSQTFKKSSHAKTSDDGQGWESTDVNDTLNAFDNSETRTPTLVLNDQGGQQMDVSEDKTATLRAEEHGHQPIVFDASRRHDYQPFGDVSESVQAHYGTGGNNVPMVMNDDNVAFTQNQRDEVRELGDKSASVTAESGTHQQTYLTKPVVRRLTPKECERLQGFPDDWTLLEEWVDTKGKKHKDSDSARYKALGNSICLPFWSWMSGRMCDQLRKSGVENPTMASLFDGISGFPLVYAQHGCMPVWSSEIEEFPIAVCKKHFGDDDTGEKGDYEQYLHQTKPFYMINTNGTVYELDRASFNQGQNALYDSSVEEDKAQTLVARDPGGGMSMNDKVIGSLCSSDYKGIRNQDISDGKYVVED